MNLILQDHFHYYIFISGDPVTIHHFFKILTVSRKAFNLPVNALKVIIALN